MKAFSICFLFLFTALFAHAQVAKPHVIEIPNHGMYIPNQAFNIVAVVDGRDHSESIGVVQKGMGNRQAPAVFPAELDIYLKGYFSQNMSTFVGVKPVTLKVDRLFVSERTMATKELGFVELAIEILSEEGGQTYSLGKFQANLEESALDVTGSHGERIYQVILNCLHQFAASGMEPVTYSESLNEPEPIDYQKLMRKGLFINFSEWANPNAQLQNTMDFKIKTLSDGTKITRYQPIDANTNKRIKGLFAIVDGNAFYINASQYAAADYFVKAKVLGRYFVFEDQVSDPVAGAAFGLIGSLASTSTNLYVFDIKSGMVRVLDNSYMKELLLPYPELMEKWNNSDGKREAKKELVESINALISK